MKEDEMDRACSTHGDKMNACTILVGKPEIMLPLGRPRRRWEDIIKMDLREIGWGNTDLNHLAQNRGQRRAHVNAVMNLPSSIKYLEFLE
jgi:hypothetical protein